METSPKDTGKSHSDPSAAFFFYMGHPIRMQILFYLTIFRELTLSELTQYLAKSKTTIHHHMKKLEEKRYLTVREKVTRNYKEIVYSIQPDIIHFIEGKKNLRQALEAGRLTPRHLAVLFQSYSSFVLAVLQRFALYLERQPDQITTEIPQSLLQMVVTDAKTYQKTLGRLQRLLNNAAKSKMAASQPPPAESYAIFAMCVPFGKLFESKK
jgi:DNA-binding transcriptional ArsR family regulator